MSPSVRYRIRDGVWRALVAAQNGETEILAEIRGPSGHMIDVRLIPLADLIVDNPLKFSFDLTTSRTERMRFQRIRDLKRKGAKLDAIWVEECVAPAIVTPVRSVYSIPVIE
jgi:hypothetical protein